MKRLKPERKPRVVGERMKKAITDELEEKLKKNTLCKDCNR